MEVYPHIFDLKSALTAILQEEFLHMAFFQIKLFEIYNENM